MIARIMCTVPSPLPYSVSHLARARHPYQLPRARVITTPRSGFNCVGIARGAVSLHAYTVELRFSLSSCARHCILIMRECRRAIKCVTQDAYALDRVEF